MPEPPVRFEDLREGMELPVLVRQVSFAEHCLFGSAIGNLTLMHLDAEEGRRLGFGGALMYGELRLAYLSLLLERWVESSGRLVHLNCRYTGADLVGDTLTVTGRVSRLNRDESGAHALCELWVDNQRGERNTVGTAELAFIDPYGG